MGGLFGKPKTPEAPKAPAAAPKIADQDAAGKVEARQNKRGGVANNVLSLGGDNAGVGKSLLGG